MSLVELWSVCRKALTKTGLQHAGPQPALPTAGPTEQPREPSNAVDWTVSHRAREGLLNRQWPVLLG